MANIFKAKTLVGRTGLFSHEVIAPNLVYNTGNQNIGGTKNFYHTPTINGDGILSSGQDIIGGDLTGDLLSSTINKLQGYPLSINSPSAGQTLIYNGETWVPGTNAGGGGGGGGLFYYFNFSNHTGIAPTGGLPTNGYHALSLLGRQYDIGSGEFTSPDLTPEDQFHLVTHFVTASGDPGIKNIPAGLWDFNIWANTNSTNATQTQMKAVVNIYDPINSSYRYVSQSDAVFLYDTTTPSQYILNVTMPQTGIQDYERIYIQLFGQKTTNPTRTITFYFDSYRPSHVHTTIPSIAGSGVVKVIDGVYQTPASTIVDIDVNPNANIQQSKIQNLTTDLASLNSQCSVLTTNLINTGSILNEKINSLSGVSVLTFGDQNISGNKTFLNNINISGTGIFNAVDLNNIDTLTLSGVDISIINGIVTSNSPIFGANLVYTTGNQRISGDKTFIDKLIAPTGFFGLNNRLSGLWVGIGGGSGNFVSGNYSFIGGGQNNTTSGNWAVVGGGNQNFTIGNSATIAGGLLNTASGVHATVGGGRSNRATAYASTIGGGRYNCATAENSTIGGGNGNHAQGFSSTIGGGGANCATASYSNVGGGFYNCATANYSNVGGGTYNRAIGDNSNVGGGRYNSATATYSNVGGGYRNCATANYANVGGGRYNCATATYSNVGGGYRNCATANYANVGGGRYNCATANYANVGGGRYNCATATYSNVGGGYRNCATANYANVGGGRYNCATGIYSTVGGGERNCAFASHGYIIGGRCSVVQTTHSGAAVLGDGQDRLHLSSEAHTLTIDFANGVYFARPQIYGNINFNSNVTFAGITTFSGQEVNLVDTALNLSGVGDMTFSGTNINFINSPVYISGTNLRVDGDILLSGTPVATINRGILTKGGFETFEVYPEVNGSIFSGYFLGKTTQSNFSMGVVKYELDETTVSNFAAIRVRSDGIGVVIAGTGAVLIENTNGLAYTRTVGLVDYYENILDFPNKSGIVALASDISDISGYVNSTDSNIVFTTGNQTISGIKNFQNVTESFIRLNMIDNSLNIPLNSGMHFILPLTGNLTTMNLLNTPENTYTFTLRVDYSGAFAITWPAGTVGRVLWPNNTAPTLSTISGREDFFSFLTYTSGQEFFGFVNGQNYSGIY